MRNTKILNAGKWALFSTSLIAFSSVYAADRGGYLGLGVGQAQYSSDITADYLINQIHIDSSIRVIETESKTSEGEENAIAGKLYGGYSFNRYFALEGFYTNFSQVDADVSWTGVGLADSQGIPSGLEGIFRGFSQADGEQSAQALGVSAIGKLPITNWFHFYGKLGTYVYQSELEYKWRTNGNWSRPGDDTQSYSVSGQHDKTTRGLSWLWGIGASFTIAERVGINLEWETYQGLKNDLPDTNQSYDIGLLSASVDYKF